MVPYISRRISLNGRKHCYRSTDWVDHQIIIPFKAAVDGVMVALRQHKRFMMAVRQYNCIIALHPHSVTLHQHHLPTLSLATCPTPQSVLPSTLTTPFPLPNNYLPAHFSTNYLRPLPPDAAPTPDELELYNTVSEVLEASRSVILDLQLYKGAANEIREVGVEGGWCRRGARGGKTIIDVRNVQGGVGVKGRDDVEGHFLSRTTFKTPTKCVYTAMCCFIWAVLVVSNKEE